MNDEMVTARVDARKKDKVVRILKLNGLSISRAINLLFDRIEREGNTAFLVEDSLLDADERWRSAACFIDYLSEPID